MIITIPKEYDSKFRFVIVAVARAKQIQTGAPTKLDLKSGKPAYLAIREAEQNLIGYEILDDNAEEGSDD